MINYDFLILSPDEFENISRDLLQKHLNIHIESFTNGRDDGIDLRSAINKKDDIIIQAKRVKTFSSLKSKLKKEVEKVKKLAPKKYIITTSVGLTPSNKKIIKNLFKPHIQNNFDILGKDELNNLLGKYKEIETQYYKLWLSSVNILNKILHSKVTNQSNFELEETKNQIQLYVQNDSFVEATKILKDNKHVIISGIPGIGKTTLARILVLHLLSKGYEEFIFLNQSIDEGFEMYVEESKQVFLFDDFLGTNFLQDKLTRNEDKNIIKFIDKIKRSKNKILILTTREYILNQAKSVSEIFTTKNLELAKCVIDLSSYTNIIKAKILSNHLFFAKVPISYIGSLILNKEYLKLIKHKNYNPRIIETIIYQKIWKDCSPSNFSKELLSYFDNPESIWLHAFENNIKELSQVSMLILLTLGTPISLEDWELSINEFIRINKEKYDIKINPKQFQATLKELENSFINTDLDSNKNIIITYNNPSIQDFLVNYLRNHKSIIVNLINAIIYQDQFFNIFSTNQKNKNKVTYSSENSELAISRLINRYSDLKTIKKIDWRRSSIGKYQFLNLIHKTFHFSNIAIKLVQKEFQKTIYVEKLLSKEVSSYMNLITSIDLNSLKIDEEKLIEKVFNSISDLGDYGYLSGFESIFRETYDKFIKSEDFRNEIKQLVESELEYIDDSEAQEMLNNLSDLDINFDFDFSYEVSELEEKNENYTKSLDEDEEEEIDFEDRNTKEEDEKEIIEEIFNSIC